MISKTNATLLGLFFAIAMLCSCSGSTPSGLSGKYAGTNSLGYAYSINFISSTDCIVSAPRRGQGPATYRVVNGHVLLSMPGGSADLTMTGSTLSFSDGGYAVMLSKQ